VSTPFRLLLRVRYGECDMQGIVFNARFAEYVDISTAELTRVLFGSVDPTKTNADWKVVKQTVEWKAPGRYDDVLDIRVRTTKIGTTSFTVATEFRRYPDETVIVAAETVYVMIDPTTGGKHSIPEAQRAALERGAPGITVDHAGTTT